MMNDIPLKPSQFLITSPPGDTLLEALETRDMTQAELALRTGRPLKTINKIIKGKTAITPETALQFERVLGISAAFWMNREQQYRESLARQEEQKALLGQGHWLDQIPTDELVKRGWIENQESKSELLDEVLKFLGVASPEFWQQVWTKTYNGLEDSLAFQANAGNVISWLRIGEFRTQEIECKPFNSRTLRNSFPLFKEMTFQPAHSFYDQLQELCSEVGIAFFVVQELPPCEIHGVTQWRNSDKAVIQLSDHHKDDASFWWAFFHSLGHLLLHGKRDVFFEEGKDKDEKEIEADQFAAENLILGDLFKNLVNRDQIIDHQTIDLLVAEANISPGVIIGCLEKFDFNIEHQIHELKIQLDWDRVIETGSKSILGKYESIDSEEPGAYSIQVDDQELKLEITTDRQSVFWPGLSNAAREILISQGADSEAGEIDERLFAEWVGQKLHEVSGFYRNGNFLAAISELEVLIHIFQQNCWRSAFINLMVQTTNLLKRLVDDAICQEQDMLQESQILSQVGEMIRQINRPRLQSERNRASYSRAAMNPELSLQDHLFGEKVNVANDD